MSDERPLLEPPTTRIGGGGSANAVAIGVVVVLVVLVWIGWSGRPAGPSGGGAVLPSGAPAPPAVGAASTEPHGTQPGSAASPTAVSPAGVTPQPQSSNPAPAATIRPSVRLADDVYAVTAGYPGAGSGSTLRVVDRGHLQASLRNELPSHSPGLDMTFELHQLSSVGMPTSYVYLGSWEATSGDFFPMTPLGLRILDARVEAQPDAPNRSLLVRRGFTIHVHAVESGSIVELLVDIELLTPTRRPADEDHRIFP